MSGSIISSIVTSGVNLGYNVVSPLSITAAGTVDNANGYGILISSGVAGTVTNSGAVIGSSDGIYVGQANATIINHSLIEGGVAGIKVANSVYGGVRIDNSGTLSGEFGVLGSDADLFNYRLISATNIGIKLTGSTITNTGTVTAQSGVYLAGGTLANHGVIAADNEGIYIQGGTASNDGSISGHTGYGAKVDAGGGIGALTNYGSISGGRGGVYAGTGSFLNRGTVSGLNGLAVGAGGSATNDGTINGAIYGAELIGHPNMLGAASLSNAGAIFGGADGVTIGANGSLLNSGYVYGSVSGVAIYNGYLNNAAHGSILNATIGVTLGGATAVAVNHGTIDALHYGIVMSSGLAENYGTVIGGYDGATLSGGSLVNFGTMRGQNGVYGATGSVVNYGLITGSDYGVHLSHAVLTNSGTISGGIDAVLGFSLTLAVEPGAEFVGQVKNQSGKGLLELTGTGARASLGGIGSLISGFNQISFTNGASWSIEGIESGLANGQTITGLSAGDTIVLDGFSASSKSYVKNSGLTLSSGTYHAVLDILGNFTTGSFQITESVNSTTIAVTCFAAGTRIATPAGEVAVEALRIGDLISTLHGGPRPVKWIGRRSYDGRFIQGNKAVLPICIKAGAIMEGVPARDLWLSPGHAISIDGMLVHAGLLINGVSVIQAETVEHVHYYHVELADHEILLAENCPAESFAGEHFRRQFQNSAEFSLLYAGQTAPESLCQPRLDHGFHLHAIRRRLRERAGLRELSETGPLRGYVDQPGGGLCFGWAQDTACPETPVCLDILHNGRRIGRVLANLYRDDVAKAGYGNGYQGFEFRLPAEAIGPIEVRRSVDGALLETAAADAARERAA